VGGIDLGLERAGMVCRWQVENEPFCIRVLEKHWPGVKRYGDIRATGADELEPVDCIAGGYPCQPFSQAGKRGGVEDPRHLWPEFARILLVLRPRFVLLENVPGHLSLGFGEVLGDLARLGYDAEWLCLRASDFGASHLRKRVFVVAYHAGLLEPGREQERRTGLGSAGEILSDTASGGWEDGEGREARPGKQSIFDDCGGFAPGPSDPRWPAILRDRPDLAPALKSPLRRVAHGLPGWVDRALSDRTKRLKALGNAVVPQVAEFIGRKIIETTRPVG